MLFLLTCIFDIIVLVEHAGLKRTKSKVSGFNSFSLLFCLLTLNQSKLFMGSIPSRNPFLQGAWFEPSFRTSFDASCLYPECELQGIAIISRSKTHSQGSLPSHCLFLQGAWFKPSFCTSFVTPRLNPKRNCKELQEARRAVRAASRVVALFCKVPGSRNDHFVLPSMHHVFIENVNCRCVIS